MSKVSSFFSVSSDLWIAASLLLCHCPLANDKTAAADNRWCFCAVIPNITLRYTGLLRTRGKPVLGLTIRNCVIQAGVFSAGFSRIREVLLMLVWTKSAWCSDAFCFVPHPCDVSKGAASCVYQIYQHITLLRPTAHSLISTRLEQQPFNFDLFQHCSCLIHIYLLICMWLSVFPEVTYRAIFMFPGHEAWRCCCEKHVLPVLTLGHFENKYINQVFLVNYEI